MVDLDLDFKFKMAESKFQFGMQIFQVRGPVEPMKNLTLMNNIVCKRDGRKDARTHARTLSHYNNPFFYK